MCGISGIVYFSTSQPVDPNLLLRLNELNAHRGPDDAGQWIRGNVGLAHRRLSIIDISPRGRQPMTAAGGRVVVTYNGEIYNYLELRDELRGRGYRFCTETDTEVLLNGYIAWGLEGLLRKAHGMFAFVLYDHEARVLYACRDRFGEKPLYYYIGRDRLVFSSELHPLWAVCAPLSIDFGALDYYLSELSVPQPRTIWREVRQVPPGYYLAFRSGSAELDLRTYWTPIWTPKWTMSEAEVLEEVERRLTAAVLSRRIGDRPIGAFLSGGVDSGLVVSTLARNSPGRVRTFSMGFAGEGGDELEAARAVARRYATEHTEIIVTPNVQGLLEDLVEHHGEPFADPSNIATYYVCREIRSHVTVALSGDGGDEVFGGYHDYGLAQRAEEFWREVPSHTLRRLARLRNAAFRRLGWPAENLGNLETYLRLTGGDRLYRQMGFDPREKRQLYAPGFGDAYPEFAREWLDRAWNANKQDSPVDTLFAASFRTRLLNDYLVKVDRVSMMNSIEVRSPFLDRELVEFVARVPNALKLKVGVSKYLLRVLAERHVAPGALSQPKRGFTLPIGDWLKRDLREFVREHLLSPRFTARGLFAPSYVSRLIDDHASGRQDHTYRIWALLSLELWFRRFPDRYPAPESLVAATASA